ncbi:MAG TPA: FecR family protein [Candidatus Binataceae bacterium]|nr:FecR family protein [Candidatus Binataceae bacterium]
MRAIWNARDAARLTLVSALVGVIFTMATASPGLAQVAGTVSSATGNVQLQRAGGTGVVISGTPVNVGDRILTGPGGHAVILLTDGSSLELGESSTLNIDSHVLPAAGAGAATQVSLFGGVLRSVANATGGPANFEVHTPNAVAAVRGTRWDTAFTDGESRATYGDCKKFTDVVVYDGVVSVRNPAAATAGGMDVPAGYEVTVPCDNSATLPGPIGMTGAHSLGLNGSSFASEPTTVVGGVPPPGCPVCVNMTPTSSPPPPPPPPPR